MKKSHILPNINRSHETFLKLLELNPHILINGSRKDLILLADKAIYLTAIYEECFEKSKEDWIKEHS